MRRFARSTLAKASLSRHYSVEAAFPWLLALLMVGYIAFHWSDPVTLAPDSGGYLRFSEHRTAGYPLFLRAVETLFGTTDAAQKAQLIIAASAFAFLGWSVHRAFRSPFFALAPVVAPIALCLVAESIIWHPSHDSESRPNLVDRHLFAKALVIEPGPTLSDPDLAGILAMGREVMAPARELIAGAPSHYARAVLLAEFEVTGQHATYSRVFSPAVRELAVKRGLKEHRVVAQIGRPAMLSSPIAWIGNALTHYTGLWSRAFVTPATLNEFQSYIDGTERNELFERISPFRQGVLHGSRLGFVVRYALGTVLAILPIAAVAATWQRLRQTCPDGRLVVAAVGALAVHSHLLFVGLFGVMAGRYADSMAPMMAVSGALLALWVLDRLTFKMSKLTLRKSSPSGGDSPRISM